MSRALLALAGLALLAAAPARACPTGAPSNAFWAACLTLGSHTEFGDTALGYAPGQYGALTPTAFTSGAISGSVAGLVLNSSGLLFSFTPPDPRPAGVTWRLAIGAQVLEVSDATAWEDGYAWPAHGLGWTAGDAGTEVTVALFPGNQAPSGAPVLSGEARVGATLSVATDGISDPDGLTTPAWSYQWQRSTSPTGAGAADIPGALGVSYVTTAADARAWLRVRVSFTDDAGATETLLSAPSARVLPADAFPVTLSSASSDLTSATFILTVDFGAGHGVGGLSAHHFTVSNASLEPPRALDAAGERWQTTVWPMHLSRGPFRYGPGEQVTVSVSLPAWAVSDGSGAPNLAAGYTRAVYDGDLCDGGAVPGCIEPPARDRLCVTMGALYGGCLEHDEGPFPGPLAVEVWPVRGAIFSAYITGLASDEIAITNGTISDFRLLSADDPDEGGYAFTVTPEPGYTGPFTVTVPEGAAYACEDAALTDCDPARPAHGDSLTVFIGQRSVLDTPPPALSVAPARAEEAPGAALEFVLTLSHAPEHTASVAYASADGTARAGADYTATSGTATFAPGVRTAEVRVPVRSDSVVEGEETVRLLLSDPIGLLLPDAPGLGIIADARALERAWLAGFARTVGGDVVDALSARAGAARTPSHLRVPARLRSPFAPAPTLGVREALAGSTFHLDNGAGDGASGAAFSAWGRGVSSRFTVAGGARGFDADAFTGLAGADAAWGAWLAGVAFSVTEADGDASGTPVSSAMTGVYPYARVAITGALSAWGALGAGTGQLDVASEDFGGEESDLDMRFAALGARHVLPASPALSGATFALLGDAFVMRLRARPSSGAPRVSAQVNRVRLALEGTRAFALDAGASLAPTLAFGLRRDGGDEGAGLAAEVRASAAYAVPGPGVRVHAHLRRRLGDDAGAERWSLGATLHVDPGAPGEGLSFVFSPALGASAPVPGADALHALAAAPPVPQPARLDAELAYARRAPHGLTSTPYAGVAFRGGAPAPRLGWRLARAGASLGVEAARDGSHGGVALRLRGGVRW